MKEHPLLFQSEMIRALMNTKPGSWPAEPIDPSKPYKFQTRRPWKVQPLDVLPMNVPNQWVCLMSKNPSRGKVVECRYGIPGDRLWSRETYSPDHSIDQSYEHSGNRYRADGPVQANGYEVGYLATIWKPSIFQFRSASRFLLELMEVRVEQVQDISEADAIAEGWNPNGLEAVRPKRWYEDLWDSINTKRGFSWNSNPWVWSLSFKVLPK